MTISCLEMVSLSSRHHDKEEEFFDVGRAALASPPRSLMTIISRSMVSLHRLVAAELELAYEGSNLEQELAEISDGLRIFGGVGFADQVGSALFVPAIMQEVKNKKANNVRVGYLPELIQMVYNRSVCIIDQSAFI